MGKKSQKKSSSVVAAVSATTSVKEMDNMEQEVEETTQQQQGQKQEEKQEEEEVETVQQQFEQDHHLAEEAVVAVPEDELPNNNDNDNDNNNNNPKSVKESLSPAVEDSAESRLAQALNSLASAPKPWFLSSREIYQAVKDSAAAIPHGKEVFDASLQALVRLTYAIQTSSAAAVDTAQQQPAPVVAVNAQQSYELINQLDGILADHLVALDDGLDGLRDQLARQSRHLITAVVLHKKKWTETLLPEDSQSAASNTRFEQALQLLTSILQRAEAQFPKTAAVVRLTATRVVAGIEQGTQFWHSTTTPHSLATSVVASLLQRAQPLVHRSVEYGAPYWNHTLSLSRPYAKPVFELAKATAGSVEEKLSSNQRFGKHVIRVHDVAFSWMEEIGSYCIPATVQIATL
jgi:hypothetical protein